MKVIFLGAPGSGKGTQAEYLAKDFNIIKISTGDILRASISAGTVLGLKVEEILKEGKLVSDDVILNLMKERIKEKDCLNGYLFDGFPRTIAQAEGLLKANIDVDYVVEIQVPEQEIIKRLTGRLVHLPSGRIYHVEFHPPMKRGVDDYTGDQLTRRDDDQHEVVVNRLKLYREQTEPLINWYNSVEYYGKAKYITISGFDKTPKEIAKEIASAINMNNLN